MLRNVALPVALNGDIHREKMAGNGRTEVHSFAHADDENPEFSREKPQFADENDDMREIGATGFEPATSASRTLRSSQAELRPVLCESRKVTGACGIVNCTPEIKLALRFGKAL